MLAPGLNPLGGAARSPLGAVRCDEEVRHNEAAFASLPPRQRQSIHNRIEPSHPSTQTGGTRVGPVHHTSLATKAEACLYKLLRHRDTDSALWQPERARPARLVRLRATHAKPLARMASCQRVGAAGGREAASANGLSVDCNLGVSWNRKFAE